MKIGNLAFSTICLVFVSALPDGQSTAQHPIRQWEVTGPYPADQVALEFYPESHLSNAVWREVEADSSGLVSLGREMGQQTSG